ncbi:hypothetical protein [Bradyrhizobium sp. Cp5.3]|uniref:hypothetical protein n=1 Tax=Bradyrhizobium sp. Cp5.3 TaxID=443598 RepID=UPI0004056038|nr:hypothetical protein [Bradyrhizobium sp. Cp5.3]
MFHGGFLRWLVEQASPTTILELLTAIDQALKQAQGETRMACEAAFGGSERSAANLCAGATPCPRQEFH